MSQKRRNHSLEFIEKVSLVAIKGEELLGELARRYSIYAITSSQLIE